MDQLENNRTYYIQVKERNYAQFIEKDRTQNRKEISVTAHGE
jgi:hypothetical protein